LLIVYYKFFSRALILLFVLLSTSASADQAQYGNTTFPNSGATEAQAAFMEGLLMLHSFEYTDARKAFQKAHGIDKDFAMAYWGEALTHYRVLWNEINLDEMRASISKLGATPEDRAARAGTAREKAYLAAFEVLLTDGTVGEKALEYARAMSGLAAAYPDDENAASFYALALLGSSGPDRDYAIYMKAAAVAERVFAKNPKHPGAAHYMIHAYDDPVHAPLGLRPALAYSEIAPAATHALHMPTHVFFPLGMWKEATELNIRAYDAGVEWGKRNDKPVNGSGAHALTWLIYSLIQEGKIESARDHMLQFDALVGQDAKRLGQFTEAWTAYLVEIDYADPEFAKLELATDGMRPRHIAMYHYIKGAAAIRSGNTDGAKKALAMLKGVEMGPNELNWSAKGKDVMVLQLQALIGQAEGYEEQAIELLTRAGQIEYSMPRRFGPPWPPQPSHELLGEVLLGSGDYAGAKKQFEIALELANGRSTSLLGLARASSKLDLAEDAQRAYDALSKNWSAADADYAPLQEVKAKLPMASR
jgi:tetratricopeptide (TPR) repeat protein